jgi:hypothetical protein
MFEDAFYAIPGDERIRRRGLECFMHGVSDAFSIGPVMPRPEQYIGFQ